MPNPTGMWQLISLALAGALIATLIELHCDNTARSPATGTLPTVNSRQSFEHLALSPNARRAHERYLL